MSATLTFLGAAGTVTGSKFLITHNRTRVLVDAGLFQGLKDYRKRNWEPLPIPAQSLDAVVISHAHLDHVGYVPALVRQGFQGPIYATADTIALAAIVLKDSARINEADASYASRHGYSKHERPAPLYSTKDVLRTLPLFTPIRYDERAEIAPEIFLTLRPAGHILGSASPLLDVAGRTVLFSGDLGRPVHPLLTAPPPPPAAHTLVIESTYGNRHHPVDVTARLGTAITATIERGGSVIIPAFAVDRTEVILVALQELRAAGAIPEVPIWVDSPMALSALSVYRRALVDAHVGVRSEASSSLLHPEHLNAARTTEESIALNSVSGPVIIVSASGMATGGRVLHHLKSRLPDPRNSVLLVGYQAVGTRGRDLLDGAGQVKIHGSYVRVRAEVIDLSGFSVHVDADEMLAWLRRSPAEPDVTYVVHGEPEAATALAARIGAELDWVAAVARDGERVLLT